MSHLRKILGTSLLSLFMVIWGLFWVCSGRVPEVNYDDEFAETNGNYTSEESDLMQQLAMLDDQTTNLQPEQKAEILQALGVDPEAAETQRKSEEEFLTEELFLDFEVEIAELERLTRQKQAVIDSLKGEIEEVDQELAALTNRLGVTEPTFASKDTKGLNVAPVSSVSYANGSSSVYELSYQSALDDVYSHNYQRAIEKFKALLRQDNRNHLADNCQYWIGECYYGLRNYEVAIAEFEKVFAFDDSNKSDDAQYMIGMSYLRIGQRQLAELELSNLLTFYGSSEYAARAERKLLDLNI